jgi:ketosteroid isomerase-like protein
MAVYITPSSGQTRDIRADLNSLVEAERAFSRASETKGMREAFLAYLADDAIVFRPHAVEGKKWYQERPAAPGMLTWEPGFADVSRAGDLGYTTGPWQFRKSSRDDQPTAYGHYVSVWRKQPDGSWRVAIDLGISHPRPETKVTGVSFPLDDRATKRKGWPMADVEAERAALLTVDRAFSEGSASRGVVAAFQSYAADDLRLYRPDAFPVIGKSAIRDVLAKRSGQLTWQPTAAEASRSGDLGYTYGTFELRQPGASGELIESGSYVRIWRKQPAGAWRVVLDITNPMPPSASQ